MGISETQRRKALWNGLLLVALVVTGCTGITPYDPPDYREEPPGNGILTGPDGEFIIYRKVDEPDTESEAGKSSDETADGEQQNIGGKEKNREIKGDEQ